MFHSSRKFEQAPLIKKLVDTFTKMLPPLTIDLVWLIIKNKPGSGFQSWHRDFFLELSKITKTGVINLGVTKRSDLLGRPFYVFINSDKKGNSNNEGTVSAAKGNDRKANDKDGHDNLPADNWDPRWIWDANVNQRQKYWSLIIICRLFH